MTTTIRGTDNSAAAPALTGNDSDTGIYFPAADTLGLVTGGTERVSVTSTGNVAIANGNLVFSTNGTGIDFSASAGGGASSSLLDDYEEGTWTPTILFGGADTTATYAFQVGTYTKIGNVVYYQAYSQYITASTTSGSMSMGGLPFTSRNTSNLSTIGCAAIDNSALTTTQPVGRIDNNATSVSILSGGDTNNWNTLTETARGASFRLYVAGHYYV